MPKRKNVTVTEKTITSVADLPPDTKVKKPRKRKSNAECDESAGPAKPVVYERKQVLVESVEGYHRHWVFTSFDIPMCQEVFSRMKNDNSVDYFVYQIETCPESKREHVQGYAIWTVRKHLSGVKKYFSRTHFEPRRGNHVQAREYCLKEESRARHGEEYVRPGADIADFAGQRPVCREANVMVNSGFTYPQMCDADPRVYQIQAGVRAHMSMLQIDRDYPDVIYYYGRSGIGKSDWVKKQHPGSYSMRDTDRLQTWGNYSGQETIIIDEFKGLIELGELNMVISSSPYNLRTMGGETPCRIKKLVFISNRLPNVHYWDSPERDTWIRRLDQMSFCDLNDPKVCAEVGFVPKDPTEFKPKPLSWWHPVK